MKEIIKDLKFRDKVFADEEHNRLLGKID